MIGALYTLIKIKEIDVSFSSFLYRQFVNDSEKLPLVFLTACAAKWNHAAMNIITIFFSSQFIDSLFISTISNFKNSRALFLKSLNSSDFLLQNRIIWAFSLPFHNNAASERMDILNISLPQRKACYCIVSVRFLRSYRGEC